MIAECHQVKPPTADPPETDPSDASRTAADVEPSSQLIIAGLVLLFGRVPPISGEQPAAAADEPSGQSDHQRPVTHCRLPRQASGRASRARATHPPAIENRRCQRFEFVQQPHTAFSQPGPTLRTQQHEFQSNFPFNPIRFHFNCIRSKGMSYSFGMLLLCFLGRFAAIRQDEQSAGPIQCG